MVVLLLWVAANRSDGDLSGMSDEDIELASDWDGEEGAFIAALRRIRFVDGEQGSTVVHDWAEHQPWAAGAGARSLKAKWNAVKRFHGEHAADKEVPEYAAIRHASVSQPAEDQHATSMGAASEQHADSNESVCSSPIRILSVSSPSPTPTLGEPASPVPAAAPKPAKAPRHSPAVPACPPGVSEQVWSDWLTLRKQKRAPVTATVVEGAAAEAVKAGISLESFLRIWCTRGSQGLQAEWIRPEERQAAGGTGPPQSRQASLEARNAAVVAAILAEDPQ